MMNDGRENVRVRPEPVTPPAPPPPHPLAGLEPPKTMLGLVGVVLGLALAQAIVNASKPPRREPPPPERPRLPAPKRTRAKRKKRSK